MVDFSGISFPLADQRNTPMAKFPEKWALANGSVAVQFYGAFGEEGPSNIGRFGFTGSIHIGADRTTPHKRRYDPRMRIPELGLYYYKARFYDPALGRFLTPDPAGMVDGPNLYAYVLNDPVNFIDPEGLFLRELFRALASLFEDGFVVNGVTATITFGGDGDGGGGGGGGGLGSPFLRFPGPNRPVGLSSEPDSPPPTAMEELMRTIAGMRAIICSVPAINVGLGVDAYAVLGFSVGGNFNLDVRSGQIGAGINVAVGVGAGIDIGPSLGGSASGSRIVQANVTGSFGAGTGFAVVGTRNLIGTDPGQTSVSAGRVGTMIGFANVGAAAGFNTPRTNLLGCR